MIDRVWAIRVWVPHMPSIVSGWVGACCCVRKMSQEANGVVCLGWRSHLRLLLHEHVTLDLPREPHALVYQDSPDVYPLCQHHYNCLSRLSSPKQL